jgi:5'-nucleotidase
VTDARPLILLSNDDGVAARGIRTLHGALTEIAEVVVVAPLTEQSAKSHALTLVHPLRHRVIDGFHAIDGTPADCIYVALYREQFLPRRPDLVVSGINHGYNLGVDVYYSGTVAAAREGALRGIPSVAFSSGPKGSFEAASEVAKAIVARFLRAKLPTDRPPLLNVNFPGGRSEYLGLRTTRIGRRHYDEAIVLRHDPRGQEYFWLGGPNAYHERDEGTDTTAVDDGYVSITPLSIEPTASEHVALAALVASKDEER